VPSPQYSGSVVRQSNTHTYIHTYIYIYIYSLSHTQYLLDVCVGEIVQSLRNVRVIRAEALTVLGKRCMKRHVHRFEHHKGEERRTQPLEGWVGTPNQGEPTSGQLH
jgi:hypothetical protein